MSMVAQINVENIPAELKTRRQWVLWHTENGQKVPLDIYGNHASSTDPTTWTDFDTAVERVTISTTFEGIGFVFTAEDPYCGIDLDGCRNPETGAVEQWAQAWIDRFATYTETSPSCTGFKCWCRGKNPKGTGGNTKIDAPKVSFKNPGVEIYDKGRFFTVTGWHVKETPTTITEANGTLVDFVATYFSEKSTAGASQSQSAGPSRIDLVERCWRYVQKCPDAISGDGGHDATFRVACECFRFGLTDGEAAEVLRRFNALKTGGEQWTEKEIGHKLQSAREKVTVAGEFGCRLRDDQPQESTRGSAPGSKPEKAKVQAFTVRELIDRYPKMRKPVIHGLQREGETMNIISAPKVGKSWLASDLALCAVTGRRWLEAYDIEPGPVLLIDNELHGETTANRIPRVADARGIPAGDYLDRIRVCNLRGCLVDMVGIGKILEAFKPGELRLVILDAFYRAIPRGVDENDNGAVANLYNLVDSYALQLGVAFVLIHHSTKGSQSGKAITDVGAGAGSQARATDTHLILRPHREAGAYVVDAAVRSWPPIQPRVLRWDWPVWNVASDLDPAELKPEKPARAKREPKPPAVPSPPPPPQWNPHRFVREFCRERPERKDTILARAMDSELSYNAAQKLFRVAVGAGLLFDWPTSDKRIREYATTKPPTEPQDEG